MLKTIFVNLFVAPLTQGGSGLARSSGDLRFLADPGPDPGGNLFVMFIFALRAAR